MNSLFVNDQVLICLVLYEGNHDRDGLSIFERGDCLPDDLFKCILVPNFHH